MNTPEDPSSSSPHTRVELRPPNPDPLPAPAQSGSAPDPDKAPWAAKTPVAGPEPSVVPDRPEEASEGPPTPQTAPPEAGLEPQEPGKQTHTNPPTAVSPQGEPLALSRVLGTVQALAPFEQASLCACEEVVRSGWHTFVQVGLALAQIRDQRLYRMEYESFEAYCEVKWQYDRRYVNQLISAAQVFTHLGAISSLKKPEHETQVRPLVGLTPEQVKLAWERAVEKAGGGRITARLVRAAVEELQFGSKPQPASHEPRQTKGMSGCTSRILRSSTPRC